LQNPKQSYERGIRQQYCRLISKSDNKIKSWNIIKCESEKLHLTEQIPSVLINSEKVNDPQIIADAFNTFFLQTTEDLSLHQEESDVISFLKKPFPRKFPGIKTIPTTKTETKSIIHSLKAENSSGYGGITSKILEVCSSRISYPLTHIYNHSLLTEIFPNRLKFSIVRSLYKKGDKTNLSNCRQISVLTTFSKILKYNRLSHYFQANNILVPEQFGFRKGISPENAAFKLTDSALKSLNKKMHVGGIFCDLAKAFSCVSNEILLSKLHYFGIRGAMENWFRSYLTEKKQKIEIKLPHATQCTYFSWEAIKHGVPQG
jgi:hypothetical protein